ncbi:28081_t:CDS:2 [Gigaspora margarita]|uniref:28081_t:CDS:1 n=1 Tax=Gigaspora margarita TaxID=4874 RepID=A0ABN7UMI9_GIGMA|nr:28081_t:CDS:2 [Gigaspora margarita]
MSYGTSQGAYPGPPPAYSPVGTSHEPPIGREWESGDDVPEDFKYGVSVSECSLNIRMAFVRKVYSILFAQIGLTTVVAAIFMHNNKIKYWVQENSWALIVSMIATFVLLLLLMWKRRSYPTNFALLAAFTLVESYSLGTLGLWVVVIAGFVSIFIPFSTGLDLAIAVFTAILFSGFVIYDTFNIMKRTSPEEYVIAAVELYLDFVNLFIAILRILNDLNRD